MKNILFLDLNGAKVGIFRISGLHAKRLNLFSKTLTHYPYIDKISVSKYCR